MKFRLIALPSLLLISLSTQAVQRSTTSKNLRKPAQEVQKAASKRIPVNTQKVVIFNYTNSKWNLDPTQIDTVVIYLRDALSGRVAQIFLQETQPDSNEFTGSYLISWPNSEHIRPEIYTLTADPQQKNVDLEKAVALIQDGKVPRKPFVLHRGERGNQIIDVYDSKEAAQRQIEALKLQTIEVAPKNLHEKLAAAALMNSHELARLKEEQSRQSADAGKREMDRVRLLEQQNARFEQRLRNYEKLSQTEREKAQSDAKQFADAALDQYRVNNFKEAETNFSKSAELDPENRSYAYQYAVTLYRNEKYNDSIVAFRLLKGDGFNLLERDFYIALNHFKLKEFDQANKIFDQIRVSKKQPLGPSSAFYMALILFDQAQYERAKPIFQEVLDTSEDPKLDERAEDYIERIERLIAFAKNKKQQFTLSLSTGLQYDSNILLTPDSNAQQSAPTNKGDARFSAGAGLMWRAIYEKNYEFSLKTRADMIYSARSEFESADPVLYSIGAPFVYKGTLIEKGYRLEVKPGYEVLMLDPSSTGTKTEYMRSQTLDLSNTLVMSENWFSNFTIKYRNDLLPNSTDQSANKYYFDFNNIYFLNKKKTQGLIGDLALTQNLANGTSYKYIRYDIGATYLTPMADNFQFIGGISYYMADYKDDINHRVDNDTTFLAVVSRPLNAWLSGNVLGTYILNNSSNSTNQYNKYTIGVNFSAEIPF